MQRLDAAIHHLREAGVVRDFLHRDARIRNHTLRATRRQQRKPGLLQTGRELSNALLVRYRQQRAPHAFASLFRFFK